MDQLDTGERRTKNLSELLHEAVEKEAINSDEQLMNSSKRGFNAQFFPKMSEVFSGAVQPKIFDENRRQRVYLLRKVMATLFPDGTIPQSLLEAGSAGDISVSLAFPDMDVESVDIDPDIFLSVSYNTLPDGFFKRIGKRRSIEGYGGKDWLGTKKRKLTMVQEALPKWKPVIEDAEELSAPDESQDIALVQGTPDMLDFFISQLARVTKPGGYIISMVDEQMREGEYTSCLLYTSRCV